MDISFFAGRHREVPLRGSARHGRDAPDAERRATAAHAGCAEASEDEALAGGEAAAVDGKAFGVQPGAWRAGAGAREGLGAGEEGEGAGEFGPWARHAQERGRGGGARAVHLWRGLQAEGVPGAAHRGGPLPSCRQAAE